jgi:hypothetical protein
MSLMIVTVAVKTAADAAPRRGRAVADFMLGVTPATI